MTIRRYDYWSLPKLMPLRDPLLTSLDVRLCSPFFFIPGFGTTLAKQETNCKTFFFSSSSHLQNLNIYSFFYATEFPLNPFWILMSIQAAQNVSAVQTSPASCPTFVLGSSHTFLAMSRFWEVTSLTRWKKHRSSAHQSSKCTRDCKLPRWTLCLSKHRKKQMVAITKMHNLAIMTICLVDTTANSY